jgi:hypothetical protein
VAAWVAPADLPRLQGALGPAAVVVPCTSFDALSAAVRGGAEAAVVGAACVAEEDVASLTALVSGHPTTVFAGLHGVANGEAEPDRAATEAAVFRLWAAGVLAVVYPTNGLDDSAWAILRRSLAAARLATGSSARVSRPCSRVSGASTGPTWTRASTARRARPRSSRSLRRRSALRPTPATSSAPSSATLRRDLGWDAAALAARFVDHGLPDADRYVAAARLVRAASLGETPATATVAAAVCAADPSEPAYIHRTVRQLRRVARVAVSRADPGSAVGPRVLDAYRAALVVPFGDALATFDPAGGVAS